MEQMVIAYGLPIATDIAIMMLYKNSKAMFPSFGGDTDSFNIVTGALQRNALSLYICF